MVYDIFFLVANLIFWASLGATEGFKWTLNPTYVTSASYHTIRGFTNGAFLCAVGLAPFALGGLSIDWMICQMFTVTVFAWPLDEMSLNYVNFGNILHQKDRFNIGIMSFKYPPIILMPIFSILGFVGYIFTMVLK